MNLEIQSLFTHIYSIKGWSNYPNSPNTPFHSGPGSLAPTTIYPYISLISNFFSTLDYKPNVVDIGCGDFNIGSKLTHLCHTYKALDIVDPLIEYNKIKYKNLNVSFNTLDITEEECPIADVIIIRQVLQHLSNENILKTLKNLYKKSKYLIITESTPLLDFTPNLNMPDSSIHRPIYNNSGVIITAPPFNFPYIYNLYELKLLNSEKSEYIQTNIYQMYE